MTLLVLSTEAQSMTFKTDLKMKSRDCNSSEETMADNMVGDSVNCFVLGRNQLPNTVTSHQIKNWP